MPHEVALVEFVIVFPSLVEHSGLYVKENCRFSTETFWRLVFSHEWFIIHLQRDEVELEINSEPRV